MDSRKTKFIVLGFSQGGHTALRWLSKAKINVNNLIVWGSGFPRDVDYKEDLIYWNNCNVKIVVGKKDKFITQEILKKEIEFLNSNGIKYELIKFEGMHCLDEYILKKIDNLI